MMKQDVLSGQIAASDEAKRIMRMLSEDEGLFNQMIDVWRWSAALGIVENLRIDDKIAKQKRTTMYSLDSLDPDGVFSSIMLSLFPDLKPDERRKKLEEYAEMGVREIYRRHKNGTLDFYKMLRNILASMR